MKEIGYVLALLVAIALITYGVMAGIAAMNAPYVDNCRAAGGVPISTGKSSYNCARPEGGWIDVPR